MPRKPVRLSQWQAMFDELYGQHNERLDANVIWLHVMRWGGEVAKDFRTEEYSELKAHVPDLFSWLCAFASRKALELEQVTWAKYPGVCPYCRRSKGCICIAEGHSIDATALQNFRATPSPGSLDSWRVMFRDIYGPANKVQSRSAVGFHLMEEIGEMADALLKPDSAEVGNALADVIAWLMAIYTAAERELGPSMSEAVWASFPYKCRHCKKNACQCHAELAPAQKLRNR